MFFWMKIQLYNSYDVPSFDPKKRPGNAVGHCRLALAGCKPVVGG
jgi:hypothetical protein